MSKSIRLVYTEIKINHLELGDFTDLSHCLKNSTEKQKPRLYSRNRAWASFLPALPFPVEYSWVKKSNARYFYEGRVFTTQKQKTNTRLDFRFPLSNAIKPLNRERETHAWLSQSRAILGKRRPWPSCVLDFWDRKYVTAMLVVFKELDYVCHKWWSYSNNIYMRYFAAVSCYPLVIRPAYWITY